MLHISRIRINKRILQLFFLSFFKGPHFLKKEMSVGCLEAWSPAALSLQICSPSHGGLCRPISLNSHLNVHAADSSKISSLSDCCCYSASREFALLLWVRSCYATSILWRGDVFSSSRETLSLFSFSTPTGKKTLLQPVSIWLSTGWQIKWAGSC